MLHSSRRRFITGLGAASVTGLIPGISGAAIGGKSGAAPVDAAASGEYMLEPGLIHLNTGTLGAMPRTVFERTVEAMRRFERNPPLQAYKITDDTLLGEAGEDFQTVDVRKLHVEENEIVGLTVNAVLDVGPRRADVHDAGEIF